jgi:hypothetical protein
MMEAVSTSETSVDNYFTQQYIPEDNSELHTRRRENLKSHSDILTLVTSLVIPYVATDDFFKVKSVYSVLINFSKLGFRFMLVILYMINR